MSVSARHLRYWSCERKRRYWSRRQARFAAKSAMSRSGKPHRVYLCDYGEHFHITKRKERP
jgi:hypothetical protein